ncbi:hypothetical protein Bca52824_033339 [Brassica carinata]|uniref:Uncharacterized protein n=1 Tax=Brassica carinata TaxID=52824 RepID=A0A8X7SCB2_BRACI|nr:hypothetical protein Bca52824_033339 [Brassica carinata]
MVKKANQDGPRRSKRQMGLDVTPTVGKTLTKGQKKAGKVVAQGRLGKLAKEKASHKRQLPSSAQVRMPEKLHNEEPGDDLDEHTDAWRDAMEAFVDARGSCLPEAWLRDPYRDLSFFVLSALNLMGFVD